MIKKVLLNISGKKPVEAEFTEKDVSFFSLDLHNPRFSHLNLKFEKQAENEIWNEKDIEILYNSILASKGISEPIYSKPNGTIIEGNRRIVCLRKIKEKYSEGKIFPKIGYKKIPVFILPNDVSSLDIDLLLARLHVSGKKEWKSLNQAEHIYNLREMHKLSFEEIKKFVGISKGNIHQKYWAYTETRKFLEKNSKESINKYSFFEEAYKKKNVKEFIENVNNVEDFYSWIINGKFNVTGAKDVRDLSKIIDKKDLMLIFIKDGIKSASNSYQNLYENPDNSLRLATQLNIIFNEFSNVEIKELVKDKNKVNELLKLKHGIDRILR